MDYMCALQVDYTRATRCWRSNNLKSCLLICDDVTKRLNRLLSQENADELGSLAHLKHLVWLLKIKCLAEDYYVDESLLLNEDDIESDDQVRVINSVRSSRTNSTVLTTSDGCGRKGLATGGESRRPKTGILTGRLPTASSRQSSRATSSYRPLTTSLTATQTAFSRSTRPLLKYSTCELLAKPMFEYLYNAQTVTNQCPDYRQCLEYLYLVQNSQRSSNHETVDSSEGREVLISLESPSANVKQSLGAFWLIAFGTCYYNLHMNKQAEEYFQLATSLNPRYLDPYAWLVKIYIRSNQLSKVLQTCHEGLNHNKSTILFNWMARVKSLINDLYGANLDLKESLKYQPTNTEALANVGHFAFYSNNLEQSLKCFERIQQISVNCSNQTIGSGQSASLNESPELLNNLALCYFYNGYYHKVMHLFSKAFLNSSGKEVTSNIWYNMSFIPLTCGHINMAIACLRLALKNNSQNEEAMNNLGVLKYKAIADEHLYFENRIEYANTLAQQKQNKFAGITRDQSGQIANVDDPNTHQVTFDEAETYFGALGARENEDELGAVGQPEMLYNMAIIKKKRGHLSASVKYCNLYLEQDPNNYHILSILKDIKDLIE